MDDAKPYSVHRGHETSLLAQTGRSHAAFVQRLPQALSYVTELESGAHAILFYDNLVAAAEYLCAFIEAGIHRQQTTSFLGLSTERYETLFDQVGINTAMLENCGYLRHLSINQSTSNERGSEKNGQLNIETLLGRDIESNYQGTRVILLNEDPLSDVTFRELMEFERQLNAPNPAIVLCCYDARQVLDEAYYNLFTELLGTHGHCLFQGIAMPTNMISRDKPTSFPAPKQPKMTNAIASV